MIKGVNIILQKHIERKGVKIHLTKFVPNKFTYLEKIFNLLIQKVENLPCKVYIFDNIYRHLNCCKLHHYKGLVRFQQIVNLKLHKILKPVPNITVLDHRRFLGFNFQKIWKISIILPSIILSQIPLLYVMRLLTCYELKVIY